MKEVQTLTQVVRTAQKGIESCRRNLSTATVKSNNDKVNLMRLYNPAMQAKYGSYPVRCVMGKAPTLAMVRREYGEQVALDWVRVQLNDYQNFVAVKDDSELPSEVADEMATLILTDWYYLKMTEIMLFFRWLKTGRYGELYGRINPQSFFVKLREFVQDRNNIIFDADSEKRHKEMEKASAEAITYDEYLKRKKAK